MKVVTIKDMIRKDVPIYYRKLFTGVAVIELNSGPSNYRLDFCIEYKPTGQKDISVSFIDSIDYPLVPVTRELKNYINELETTGALPD
ncbi:MAG: hypothetical protein LBQ93_10255 [Treponema sp.]|jgi:hypothetical protein|nr:hypothetical protein [Treponema sp.]